MEALERLLTTDEILTYLGISNVTLWKMEKEGKFPKSIRVGFGKQTKRWRYSDFKTWMDSLAEPYKAKSEAV